MIQYQSSSPKIQYEKLAMMCFLNFVVLTIFVFVRKDGGSIITSSSEEGSLRKDVCDTTLSKTRLYMSMIIVVVACANHLSFIGRHVML